MRYGFVICMFGIPEAEAVVVFGGDDEIFHPRVFCGLCPKGRVVEVGVELFEISLVIRAPSLISEFGI